jgi:hypothetical protein
MPIKSGCGKCGTRPAPGVLFGVFGVCLGSKLALFNAEGLKELRVETGEIIEIANADAVVMHIAENLVGDERDWMSIPPLPPKAIPKSLDAPFLTSDRVQL